MEDAVAVGVDIGVAEDFHDIEAQVEPEDVADCETSGKDDEPEENTGCRALLATSVLRSLTTPSSRLIVRLAGSWWIEGAMRFGSNDSN